MSRFRTIARDLGNLVEAKNAAYGDSLSTAGDALRLLYPHGIPPAKMSDALIVGRVWDKLMRVATDRDAFGESPWVDIAGYAILAIEMHGGKVDSRIQKAVPARRMHQSSQAQSGQVLLRRLPHERLPRDERPEAASVSELRLQAPKTGPSGRVVKGRVTKSKVDRFNSGKKLWH